MTKDIADNISSFDYQTHLYGNALTEKTEKIGNKLIFLSAITIIISTYDIRINSIPFINIPIGHEFSKIGAILSFFSLFLFSAYVINAASDYLRAKENWRKSLLYFAQEKKDFAQSNYRRIEDEVYSEENRHQRSTTHWEEDLEKIITEVNDLTDKIQKEIQNRNHAIKLRHVRLFLSVTTPALLGLITFFQNHALMLELTLDVIQSFRD